MGGRFGVAGSCGTGEGGEKKCGLLVLNARTAGVHSTACMRLHSLLEPPWAVSPTLPGLAPLLPCHIEAERKYAADFTRWPGPRCLACSALCGAEMAMIEAGIPITPGSGVSKAIEYWQQTSKVIPSRESLVK